MSAKYSVGDSVQIKNSDQIATIKKVCVTSNAIFYFVGIDGKRKRVKEEDLIPYIDTEDSIYSDFSNQNFANVDQFQRYVYYRQFSETQDSNIYSYQGNRIIFNPFQYKPLMKFLSMDSDERILVDRIIIN